MCVCVYICGKYFNICVLCVSLGVCVCVYVCKCVSLCMSVCRCICVSVCSCVCMCLQVHELRVSPGHPDMGNSSLPGGSSVLQSWLRLSQPPHPRHPPGLSSGPRCPGAREVGALFQPVLEPQPCLEPRGDSPAGCISARPGTWPGSRATRTGPWGFHNQPTYCPGTLASPPPLLSRPGEDKVWPGPPNC